MKSPVRATIVYALASGFIVVPLATLLSTHCLSWPTAFKLAMWSNLAIYGVMLARWGGARLLPVFFPLAILFGAALWPRAYGAFFVLALGVLAWIRSGICFQGTVIRALTAEGVTLGGSAAVLLFFGAHSPVAWALNICLFYLMQSLYFFIVPRLRRAAGPGGTKDAFELAAEEARKVMDGV